MKDREKDTFTPFEEPKCKVVSAKREEFAKIESGLQTQFAENYDLKLALSLSKTEAEARRSANKRHTGFAHILPPEEAFQVIKERLNLIYHE